MLDGRVDGWVGSIRTGVVVDVAKLVTNLGALPVVGTLVLISVALLAWRRRPYELFVLLVGSLLVYGATHIAKDATDRPRPPGSLVDTMTSAFPSGHAAYSVAYVAMGVIAARVLPGLFSRAALVIGTVVLAAAIGATRVYLGAHYYSDVVAGWSLAASAYALCAIVALVVSYVRQNGRERGAAGVRPATAPDHG
jgi:undecaprenyl-diphosphatase